MLIAVMNKGVGKTRDVGKLTGEAKMNAVVKRTGAWQIRSGSARRSIIASTSVIVLTKTVAEKLLASPRGWLVRGPWRTSGARRKNYAIVIDGRTDPRCCMAPRRIWRICPDPMM
jgi:hypothetical protein